jgi:uncharacterized protein
VTIEVAVVFLIGGLIAGFLTGMLGLGGGVVMVPIIYQSYLHLGASSKSAFITSVASSLAVIIFTGSYASWLHYREDRLDLRLTLWMGIGTVGGAFAGSHLLLGADNNFVRLAFGIFLWTVAASMLLPKAELRPHREAISPLYKLGLAGMGLAMGVIASLFGVGGAALAVPALMLFFGVSVHHAIAAASSMIVLTAVFSSASYIVTGWHNPAAPAHGIGWIDPIAVALLLPGAMLTTRIGVKIAQGFSRQRLRNMLMLFQIVVGARFIFS